MRRTIARPRIGVALGGGSARGLTHIPYIEAMDELGLRPHVIAGTSIGALIGAGWANGMTGAELREHLVQRARHDEDHRRAALGRAGAQSRQLLPEGLLRAARRRAGRRRLPARRLPARVQGPEDPFYVVATDFQSLAPGGVQFGARCGRRLPARSPFRACSSRCRSPITCSSMAAWSIRCRSTRRRPTATSSSASTSTATRRELLNKTNHKALDVWFGSAQIMMHSLTAHMMAAYPPDVYVRPHLSSFGALEFWRVREIVAHVEKDKDNFKRALSKKVEAFLMQRGHDAQNRSASAAKNALSSARSLSADPRNDLRPMVAVGAAEQPHAVVDRAGLRILRAVVDAAAAARGRWRRRTWRRARASRRDRSRRAGRCRAPRAPRGSPASRHGRSDRSARACGCARPRAPFAVDDHRADRRLAGGGGLLGEGERHGPSGVGRCASHFAGGSRFAPPGKAALTIVPVRAMSPRRIALAHPPAARRT